MVQWLKLHAPNSGGLDLIPGQGIRSHMPKLKRKDPHATTKIWYSQINKSKYLKSLNVLMMPVFTFLASTSLLNSTLVSFFGLDI